MQALMLCPSIHGIMVNLQCALYTGWSRYTEIITKLIEPIK